MYRPRLGIEGLEPRRLFAVPPVTWDTFADTWVATDALNRSLPTNAQVGAPRAKQVGVFYFLWLGQHSTTVYDNTQLIAANPTNPAYGPVNAFHHWGKPLFDYYRSDDRSVIRKHLQMLGDAGVDFISLDMTNNLTYGAGNKAFDALTPILETIVDMQNKGLRVPRATILASTTSLNWMWTNIYSTNTLRNSWYEFAGKPLIMVKSVDTIPTQYTSADFTIRRSWAWNTASWWGTGATAGQDRWPWIQDNPTQFGWSVNNTTPEEMAVAVASHANNSIGRSYRPGFPQSKFDPTTGIRFTDQIIPTLDIEPEVVFLTGWNEWVAQRFVNGTPPVVTNFAGTTIGTGDTYFVDNYNFEYSREIEPGFTPGGDNYVYQMASFIRKFKGARTNDPVGTAAIDINGDFSDWAAIDNRFRDDIGDQVARNNLGYNGVTTFTNTTGRADIVEAKLATDATNVYFYARTNNNLSSALLSPNWMTLYIDADQDASTGWLGYDFVLNRTRGTGWSMLQKNVGNANTWADVTRVPMKSGTREVEIAVTRAALGLPASARGIDFKWAENVQSVGDWTDFTLNGDAAPNDRYNYRGNFSATADALPSGWTATNIGATNVGTSAATDRSITLTHEGGGIEGSADSMRYVYRAITGNVELIARVSQLDRADDFSRAGLVIRQDLTAGSKNVGIFTTGFNGNQLQVRTTANGGTGATGAVAQTQFKNAVWLKLVRTGNSNFVYTSPDGVTWTNVGGSQGVAFTGTFYVGLALSSRRATVPALAKFDNIRFNLDPAPALQAAVFDCETRHEAVLYFNKDVASSLSASDVVVTNLTTNSTVSSGYTVSTSPAGGATALRVTFAPFLADGRYRVRVLAGSVADAFGTTNATDLDFEFTALVGDTNGSGVVDFNDLLMLAQNYGRDTRTFSQGNVTYDSLGKVDFDDLLTLAQRYNQSVVVAATTTTRPRTRAVSHAVSVVG